MDDPNPSKLLPNHGKQCPNQYLTALFLLFFPQEEVIVIDKCPQHSFKLFNCLFRRGKCGRLSASGNRGEALGLHLVGEAHYKTSQTLQETAVKSS